MIKAALKTYCFVLLAALMSCRDNHALQEAESLLETNPAAADSILTSMPAPTSNRDRAWHAVLKTQADYKLYKPITSDSLILTATNYYGIHRKNFRSALAWYTQGCVYKEMSNDLATIDAYLRAEELFPDTLSRYFALTEQNIGDILLQRDMNSDAFNYFKRAIKTSEKLHDSTVIAYSKYKQSLIYLYEADYIKAGNLLNELDNNSYLTPYYRIDIKLGLSKVATFHEQDYTKSISITDYCIDSKSHRASGYNLRGINYLYLNELDSAIICFNKSLSYSRDIYTDYSNYLFLSETSIRHNETEKAMYYFSLYETATDSIISLLNHEEISSILLSHSNERHRNEMTRNKYVLFAIITFSSILIVFLTILTLVERDRSRKKYYISKNDQILGTINVNTEDTLMDIFNHCKNNFEKSTGAELTNKILKSRKNNSNDSAVIKHDIKICFNEFYLHISDEKHKISNADLECLICVLFGFDNKEIALVLDKSYSTITSVKARLKNKLPEELLKSFF